MSVLIHDGAIAKHLIFGSVLAKFLVKEPSIFDEVDSSIMNFVMLHNPYLKMSMYLEHQVMIY